MPSSPLRSGPASFFSLVWEHHRVKMKSSLLDVFVRKAGRHRQLKCALPLRCFLVSFSSIPLWAGVSLRFHKNAYPNPLKPISSLYNSVAAFNDVPSPLRLIPSPSRLLWCKYTAPETASWEKMSVSAWLRPVKPYITIDLFSGLISRMADPKLPWALKIYEMRLRFGDSVSTGDVGSQGVMAFVLPLSMVLIKLIGADQVSRR